MEVRLMQYSDIDQVAVLLEEFRLLYGAPPDLEKTLQYLKDRFENEQSKIFIALDGNEYLGFCQMYPTFSSISLKKLYILKELYVVKSHRKKGVAKELIQHAEKSAKRFNTIGLIIETRITNQSALKFYDSVGYLKEGEHIYYYLDENN